MNTAVRMSKSFKNLASYSKEVLVSCPNCGKRATVISSFSQIYVPYPWRSDTTSMFQCNNCFKPLDEKYWRGPIIISPLAAKCGNCGDRLKRNERTVKKYQGKMKVKCDACGQVRLYETQYKLTFANNNQATDPHLGLPLWLQIPVDNNILWAYNFEHLNYLKEYVGAKLREAVEGGKYSLAWKLPNFIKVAKNRNRILKAIGRLEKM